MSSRRVVHLRDHTRDSSLDSDGSIQAPIPSNIATANASF